MRRKKKQRLKEEAFWSNFFYFNVPDHLNEVPAHLKRVNFRIYNVDDEGLFMMTEYVTSIDQLDLDETDITNEGIKHLTRLESIKELRLKSCRAIDDNCMPNLLQMRSLELLHLVGTSITVDGLKNIGSLKNLKKLLISAPAEEQKEQLQAITATLPFECELIVNYKDFERES